MCLTVAKKYHRGRLGFLGIGKIRPLVAKEPIKVFKVLRYNHLDLCWESPFLGYIYNLSTPVRAVVELRDAGHCMYVDEGIHAYVNEPVARLCRPTRYYKHHVFAAEIPVGTKYYIGENDDIVAECLVIKEKL